MPNMTPDELRKAVIRRMRYATNALALADETIPPEGPIDVAITNGLLAIVAFESPNAVYGKPGSGRKARTLSASQLIETAVAMGGPVDAAALTEALAVTQPMRHGNADDEWVAPAAAHVEAVLALDAHPALDVLELARGTRRVDDLLVALYRDAAYEMSPAASARPKEREFYPEPQECEECWRETFLPVGYDEYGGSDSPGTCVACGYERDAKAAHDLAEAAEWRRYLDRNL